MSRLRRYRFLFIVCSLAVLAGVWEYAHSNKPGEAQRGTGAGAPKMDRLPPDRDVYVKVFRDTSNARFDLGLEYYNQRDYVAADENFRAALANGVKTNEDLLWYHILTQMHLKKDQGEIAPAIAAWRRNFPHSDKYSVPYWTFAVELLETGAAEGDSDAAVAQWREQPEEQEMPDPYWAVAARLVQRDAEPAAIESAVTRWRRKSPSSKLPDPRRATLPREKLPRNSYRN